MFCCRCSFYVRSVDEVNSCGCWDLGLTLSVPSSALRFRCFLLFHVYLVGRPSFRELVRAKQGKAQERICLHATFPSEAYLAEACAVRPCGLIPPILHGS